MKNKTQIFKSYSEFLQRIDKSVNGVDDSFSKENTNYESDNETNEGCWNCSYCSYCSDCSSCSYCSDCIKIENKNGKEEVNGKSESWFKVPIIESIHTKVLEAVKNDGALNMGEWHTCETTHCRGGWVEFLAGKEGKELAEKSSTLFAAMQIYKESSPIKVSPTRFFEDNKTAMADIERCAAEEQKLNSLK